VNIGRESELNPSNLRATFAGLLSLLVFALAACSQGGPAASSGGNERWTKYVDDFTESYFKAHPDFAVNAGRHEFDGQIPATSAAGIAAEI
jgi:hypothetical protein